MTAGDFTLSARQALLDHLPKDLILARCQSAGGRELSSGKFANPESSAALAANAVGLFADRPELLSLPFPALAAGSARSVQLEAQMRFPWSGGYHPWLDVAVVIDGALIGIESKHYEPFRDRKTAAFSTAYARPVWGEAMAPFEAMRDALQAGRAFQVLDAAKLVKHASGPRTEARRQRRQSTLCYLYAEPKAFPDGRLISPSDLTAHRRELAAFSADVTAALAEVQFCRLTYVELLAHWAGRPTLRDHATALAARFDG